MESRQECMTDPESTVKLVKDGNDSIGRARSVGQVNDALQLCRFIDTHDPEFMLQWRLIESTEEATANTAITIYREAKGFIYVIGMMLF